MHNLNILQIKLKGVGNLCLTISSIDMTVKKDFTRNGYYFKD